MVSQPSTSDSEDEHEFLQYKLVILGDGAIGKTSLSLRFSEDKFLKSYKQTIGVDFFLKELTLPGDKRVAVQVKLADYMPLFWKLFVRLHCLLCVAG
ncbi:TPA: hypothetical protein ACH3X2_004736 [Trebouxia sp. C0005]